MIRIRATENGTFTVYRDDTAPVMDLTREQAQAAAQSLGGIVYG